MSDEGIHVPYNRDLKTPEKLLSGVRQPGDFFVEAAFESALPRSGHRPHRGKRPGGT